MMKFRFRKGSLMVMDAGERLRGVIDRMRAKPEEAFLLTEAMRTKPDQLELITEALQSPPVNEPKRYTADQAAKAILWQVEDLVRATAAKHNLDSAEVHRQVFRRVALASLRLRDHPNELVEDVRDVAVQYRTSQMYQGSGCD